ncbi:MAG: DUF4298 domain-containing protein [Bacteroidales bacterium]|nr:DUF4298 domain-containing protein [Bacteroidales bacterium]
MELTQIDRIRRMEELFDKSVETIRQLEQAMQDFAAAQSAIDELEAYYASPVWLADFEADEAGILPADLKRGVLAEDGLYNLLDRYEQMRRALGAESQNEMSRQV